MLEEFISSELEGTLEEVASSGGTETGQEGAGTLLGDDLAEATDEALVVGDGVKLDAGLDAVEDKVWSVNVFPLDPSWLRFDAYLRDKGRATERGLNCPGGIDRWQRGIGDSHIDGSEGTVGDGAADGTGESESRVEGDAAELRGLGLQVGSHCEGELLEAEEEQGRRGEDEATRPIILCGG